MNWKPKQPFDKDIYAISDAIEPLEYAVTHGSRIIQLRDKTRDPHQITWKIKYLLQLKKHYDFFLILNDDPQLAKNLGVDGVHVGQDDTPIPDVRDIVGPDFIVGKTTHSLIQARAAEKEQVDYISVGPVFETPTKPGRKAVGLSYVKEAAESILIPFVAIGGIDASNIDVVLAAGAKTIGVVRAIPETAVLLSKIKEM